MLGLPDEVTACLFDMDGVLTRTAVVHAAAWKETFDAYLAARSARTGETGPAFAPMTPTDYDRFVDGKPRLDGTRGFLESRGLTVPLGGPDDPPTAETLHGLANAKNERVLARLAAGKVEAYEGSVRYVEAARAAGLRTAVVSSSVNTAAVLESAGIAHLFDARIDGLIALDRKLPGKPAPDTYLAGAAEVGATAASAAVFEDALAGVAAGRAGDFRLVVGVDRVNQAPALREHGADVVVQDLSELMEDT